MSILIFFLIGRAASEDSAIDRTKNTRRVGVLELELSGNPGSISFPYLLLKILLDTFVCMYAKLQAGCCIQMAGNASFFSSDWPLQ